VASRWEKFQIREARKIVEFALSMDNDPTASLHHVWAGLDALQQGNVRLAMQYAQQVGPHELVGWYPTAYSILVAGCELWPDERTDPVGRRSAIANFTTQRLAPDAFKTDRLTHWFIARIRASLARAHGARFIAVTGWLQALYLRWF